MRAMRRLLFIAALSALAAVAAADAPVEGSAKADEAARVEAIKEALANAKLPEWMDTTAQHKSLCCSLAAPGYEKQLLNCVRRNGPMPVGVKAEEEADGYTQEEGKKVRQKKAFDGSGRILVLMEVRRAGRAFRPLASAPDPSHARSRRPRDRPGSAAPGSPPEPNRHTGHSFLRSDLPGPARVPRRASPSLQFHHSLSARLASLRPAPTPTFSVPPPSTTHRP